MQRPIRRVLADEPLDRAKVPTEFPRRMNLRPNRPPSLPLTPAPNRALVRSLTLGIGLACLFPALPDLHGPAQAQEWGYTRQNPSRTGFAPGQGDIDLPAVRARAYAGGSLSTVSLLLGDINNDGRPEAAMVVSGKVILKDMQDRVLWDTLNIQATQLLGQYDFDGDSSQELLVLGNDGLYVLRCRDGEILWHKSAWTSSENQSNYVNSKVLDLTSDGLPEIVIKPHWISTGAVYAYTFSKGFGANPDDNLLWTHVIQGSLKNGYFPVVADMDNDGKPEVASEIGSAVEVFDATTGANKLYLPTATSMYGGRTEIVQMDDDPQLELLMVSNATDKSFQVLDLVKNKTALMAQQSFGAGDSLAPPNKVIVDLDGDGVRELLINRFDGTNWYGLIYHYTETDTAAKFSETIRLTDTYILGSVDLNGDGQVELLTRTARPGLRTLEPFATVAGWNYQTINGSAVLIPRWSIDEASLPLVTDRGTPAFNSYDSLGIPATRDIDHDGVQELFLSVDKDNDNLSDALQVMSMVSPVPGQLKLVSSFPYSLGYGLGMLALGDGYSTNSAKDEAVFLDTNGLLQVLSSSLKVQEALKVGGHFRRFAQVVDADGDGQKELMISTSSSVLRSLKPMDLDQTGVIGAPSERWAYNGGTSQYGLAVDIDGDGQKESVVRNARSSGAISLDLLDSDGDVLYSWPFASLPFNFVVADFVGSSDLDVFGTRLGADGAFYNFVVDGGTWTLAWESKAVYPESGNPPVEDLTAVPVDFNGDNRADIIYGHQWFACKMEGLTGKLVGCSTRDTYLFGGGIAVGQFDTDAAQELALLPNKYVSLMDTDFNNTYKLARAQGESADWTNNTIGKEGAFADANKDGKLETYAVGANTLYRFNPDGTTAWITRLDKGTTVTSVTASRLGAVSIADIDGDGALEALTGSSDGFLYCINTNTGALEWSVEFFYQVGEPVLADFNNDGRLDITVAVADGYIYMLTTATLPPISNVRDVAVAPDGTLINPGTDSDQTEVIERLGAAWDPVTGAAGYMVAVLSDRNTYVVDWMDVGNDTQVVISDSRLVYGHTYKVVVEAYDDERNGSPWALSDGVIIVDNTAPSVASVYADPDPFNPDLTGTTLHAQLSDLTGLVSYRLDVSSTSTGVVFSRTEGISSTSVSLSIPWNGKDTSGTRVPDGTYTISVSTTDYGGKSASRTGSVEVNSDVPTPTPPPTPTPTLPPTPTATVAPTPTAAPTPTGTPGLPTDTPVSTPTLTPGTTATPEEPTPTSAVTPTAPVETPTATLAPTPTATAVPEGTTPPDQIPTDQPDTPTPSTSGGGCSCSTDAPMTGGSASSSLLVLLGAGALLRRRRGR